MNDEDETPTPRETPLALRQVFALEELRAIIERMPDQDLRQWLCRLTLLDGETISVNEVERYALIYARETLL